MLIPLENVDFRVKHYNIDQRILEQLQIQPRSPAELVEILGVPKTTLYDNGLTPLTRAGIIGKKPRHDYELTGNRCVDCVWRPETCLVTDCIDSYKPKVKIGSGRPRMVYYLKEKEHGDQKNQGT
jgi:hypothetical protein